MGKTIYLDIKQDHGRGGVRVWYGMLISHDDATAKPIENLLSVRSARHLNQYLGSRMHLPGDTAFEFSTRVSVIKAAKQQLKKLYPDADVLMDGKLGVALAGPDWFMVEARRIYRALYVGPNDARSEYAIEAKMRELTSDWAVLLDRLANYKPDGGQWVTWCSRKDNDGRRTSGRHAQRTSVAHYVYLAGMSSIGEQMYSPSKCGKKVNLYPKQAADDYPRCKVCGHGL